MTHSKVTYRYAKTLFLVAAEKGSLDSILQDMKTIQDVFGSIEGIESYINNPVVHAQDIKEKALSPIWSHLSELSQNFVDLLIQKGRLPLILELPQAFISIYESKKDILRVSVKSAHRLTQEQESSLKQKLVQATSAQDIIISNIVDPKLIAGFQIQIGDTLVESNVKNKLVQLKRSLAA
jgi:F-type H+-transporting ATPase subunit delta